MNNKVKRYILDGFNLTMSEFSLGDWVSYEDYAKLKEQFDKINDTTNKKEKIDGRTFVAYLCEVDSLNRELVSLSSKYENLSKVYLNLSFFSDESKNDLENNNRIYDIYVENKELKEKIKKLSYESLQDINKLSQYHSEISILKDKIEKLIKAGDSISALIGPSYVYRKWISAKEYAIK